MLILPSRSILIPSLMDLVLATIAGKGQSSATGKGKQTAEKKGLKVSADGEPCCCICRTFPDVPDSDSLPSTLAIKDYSSSYFDACSSCSSSGSPEWDGTFIRTAASPPRFDWQGDIYTFPFKTANGKLMAFADVWYNNGAGAGQTGVDCPDYCWHVTLACAGSFLFEGWKKGDSPLGVYTRVFDPSYCHGTGYPTTCEISSLEIV
jgi:hypothetical protein